jgi:hypothetical protein
LIGRPKSKSWEVSNIIPKWEKIVGRNFEMGLKTKLSMALMTSIAGAIMIVSGSFAFFSATASNTGNTFSAGTVKLGVGGVLTKAFNVSNAAPGDAAATDSFTVTNSGSLDEYYQMMLLNLQYTSNNGIAPATYYLTNEDGSVYNAVNNAAGTTHTSGQFDPTKDGWSAFASFKNGQNTVDNGKSLIFQIKSGNSVLFDLTGTDSVAANDGANGINRLAAWHLLKAANGTTAADSEAINTSVQLALGAGNTYQGLGIRGDIQFNSQQAAHNNPTAIR